MFPEESSAALERSQGWGQESSWWADLELEAGGGGEQGGGGGPEPGPWYLPSDLKTQKSSITPEIPRARKFLWLAKPACNAN